ncbi:granzyme D-like [Vanessa cardui]|uniref:granzyme D-like n=1 Tax=Vanessa cardui TaxID=171605 RepID=UPI001F12B8ED|nr:granzyme D-like [Vanessa cardui]
MRILILIVATAALLLENVASEEDGIKRGTFPFMAFVYYPDQTVVNPAGGKFIRSAVLIRDNWLISSSLESENTLISFPEKTLVARLGAISIDDKMDLNEDEDEQEREIIRIARPFTFNSSEWWNSDISLLKTLLPFNITLAVAPFETRANKLNSNENCFMLVYSKLNENATDTRYLKKISVELISSLQDKCGPNFNKDNMVCAAPSSEKNDMIYVDSNFCMDNSGGPLICDNELTGIQTYVDNCNQPYLYQLLNAWDDLISCATEEKCAEEQCSKICYTINKDPVTLTTPNITYAPTEAIIKLADGYVNESNFEVSPILTSEKETSETETVKITLITVKESEATTTETTTLSTVSETQATEYTTIKSSPSTERETTSTPEERERETNVEAQQHVTVRSDASINMLYSLKYFIYVFFVIV